MIPIPRKAIFIRIKLEILRAAGVKRDLSPLRRRKKNKTLYSPQRTQRAQRNSKTKSLKDAKPFLCPSFALVASFAVDAPLCLCACASVRGRHLPRPGVTILCFALFVPKDHTHASNSGIRCQSSAAADCPDR